MFKKIQSESVVNKVIRQLLFSVENGNLNVGDKLPPERDLASRMGVSRNTLREAIKILAFLNIVKMQHGSGTHITSDELVRFRLPASHSAAISQKLRQDRSLFELEASPFGLRPHRTTRQVAHNWNNGMMEYWNIGPIGVPSG